MTPPTPSVDASRNLLRGNRSPGAGGGIAASPTSAGIAGAAVLSTGVRRSGATGSGTRRYSALASRTHRNANTIVIAPPIGAITVGLTISPTRMQTMPAAKPIGYSDGPGV